MTAWLIEPVPASRRHPYRRWAVSRWGWGRIHARFCDALRTARDTSPGKGVRAVRRAS